MRFLSVAMAYRGHQSPLALVTLRTAVMLPAGNMAELTSQSRAASFRRRLDRLDSAPWTVSSSRRRCH